MAAVVGRQAVAPKARGSGDSVYRGSCCSRKGQAAKGYVRVKNRDVAVTGVSEKFGLGGVRSRGDQGKEGSPF